VLLEHLALKEQLEVQLVSLALALTAAGFLASCCFCLSWFLSCWFLSWSSFRRYCFNSGWLFRKRLFRCCRFLSGWFFCSTGFLAAGLVVVAVGVRFCLVRSHLYSSELKGKTLISLILSLHKRKVKHSLCFLPNLNHKN
jgi:hypothetical protein